MKIGDKLLEKYNVPVPRYTSYPPANHFNEIFDTEKQIRMIRESNRDEPAHMAIYIHIPFCNKICFYCACNACSMGKGNLIDPYINALKKEIRMVSEHIDKSRRVTQIHYGGGTPNSIPSRFIAEINELLFSELKFIDKPEIAIECHPAYLDDAYIADLAANGFNRFSLGIQDFDKDILKLVNREPSRIPFGDLIQSIKSHGDNISVNTDFIYGLPGQTIESFTKTILEAITLRPDRLVTFSYAHVPWMKKHQQILEKRGLPGPEQKIGMFLAGYELLKETGYQPVGLDHFVLPEDELFRALNSNLLHRNFQGYCTRSTTGQVYAFGVSAISQLAGSYIQNVKENEAYIDLVNSGKLAGGKGHVMTKDQTVIREAITDLMCNKKLNWAETAGRAGILPEQLKQTLVINEKTLHEFRTDGLLDFSEDEILLTEKGSHFIRNIAASFDPAFQSETRKYSKAV
jgi:oxygen-independent coproporphyrinogen III oxidase